MVRLKHIVQVNLLLGVWLIVGPFAMGYAASTVELANDVGLGVVLIGCSWWILAAGAAQVGASTLGLLAGVWLVAAPFVLRYQSLSRPFSNDVIVGILSAMVSATATWMLASRLKRAA